MQVVRMPSEIRDVTVVHTRSEGDDEKELAPFLTG